MQRIAQLILHWLRMADHPEPWDGPNGEYFISDKEATCAYLRSCFSPIVVARLSKILGTTILAKINGRSFLIAGSYVEESRGHRVLRRGRDFVISEAYSAVWERHQRSKALRDDADLGYWIVEDDPLSGYREYFRRMTAEEFQGATAHLPHDHEGFPITTPPHEETLKMARRFSQRRWGTL